MLVLGQLIRVITFAYIASWIVLAEDQSGPLIGPKLRRPEVFANSGQRSDRSANAI